MTDIIDILEALWDAYGRSKNENQIRVYVNWAKTTDANRLKKVVDTWIGNEKFFPSLSDLRRLYSNQNRTFVSITHSEECWFCGGVGMIPSIDSRENRHYIVNYGCKCTNFTTSGVEPYFSKFPKLEYGEYADKFDKDEFTYPQIVDMYLMNELLPPKERIVGF
jgi:hypothetical protein